MGKKKERKQFTGKVIQLSPELLEQQARKDLREGRFRRAKEGFKELCKINKDKYRRELVECYYKMAHHMIQNGQLSDAQNIISNIKVLTGNSYECSLDVLIAIKKKDYDSAARLSANLLLQGKDILNTHLTPVMADALVLAFQDFHQIKAANPQIYDEIKAIHQALENFSAEKYEEAWECVKKIGIHSLFSNWKLFIKGLIAFYKKEDRKARAAFEHISPDTLLWNTVKSFLTLMGTTPPDPGIADEKTLQKACILAGHSDLASVLPKAAHLWNAGRYYDSYLHVRNHLANFPAEGTGMRGELTRFYFNIIHRLPEDKAENYLHSLTNKHFRTFPRSGLEDVLISKARCLFFEDKLLDDIECARVWEDFLIVYKKIYGTNNKLEALVYSHLGSIFAEKEATEGRFFLWGPTDKNKDGLRNPDLAEHYFNKSIALVNNNKDVYLNLLRIYDETRNKAKRNRLLDKLIPLFPDDQTILARAGIGCLDRKAYLKGIKYLEQASRLDPLDRTIKEHLAIAYLKAAQLYFKKGQAEQGRKIYKKALENGVNNPDDFNRGCAFIYARWSALEFKSNNEHFGEEALRQAKDKTDNPFILLYFAQLIYQYYGVPDVYIQRLKNEVKSEWQKTPTPQNAASLLKVFYYINELGKFTQALQEKKRIIRYAHDAAEKTCTRNDAISIVQFALTNHYESTLAEKYINKMLKEDENDPLFLYFRFKLRELRKFYVPARKDIDELNRILCIAEKRNDMTLVRNLQKKINDLNKFLNTKNILSNFLPF